MRDKPKQGELDPTVDDCRQWRNTIEKVGGGEVFYLSIHNQQMCSEGTLSTDIKNEKLAQMRSNAEHLLLVPSVAQERFLGQGLGEKTKFCFASKLPSIFIN